MPALAQDESKVREALMGALKIAQAPLMTADPCDDDEFVNEALEYPPNVILDWEELEFDFDTCEPRKSASSNWVWTAKLDWPCRVSLSKYLDSVLENPIIVPGEPTPNNPQKLSTPNRIIRFEKAENHPRPTQGSQKGSGLTLTFSVNRPPQS